MTNSTMLVFDRKTKDDREYWLKKLGGAAPTSYVPTDFARPANYSGESDSIEIALEGELFLKLRQLTGGKPFLAYTALMAALKACLHKYSGETSIAVGSPARGESEATNALACMDQIDPRRSFRELLMQVRQTLLDAYKRQSYPYARLVRDLNLDHVENRFPLFDIALSLSDIHGPLPRLRNDVSIRLTMGERGLKGYAAFSPGLYRRETIERLSRHFLQLLRQGLEDPNLAIAKLQMADSSERRRVLEEWAGPRLDYRREASLASLFEEQARQSPQATAATFAPMGLEAEELTYDQLNRKANRLAAHLRACGVGPGARVALLLERSLDLPTAILGVLKAGAAYMPIDPSYPAQRVSFMLDDCQASALITHRGLELPTLEADLPAVRIDSDWEAISARPEDDPTDQADGHDPACLIYTSGSTGQPKGALIEHRNIHSLVIALEDRFYKRIPGRLNVALLAPYVFDASIQQIFAALLRGHALHIAPEEARYDGRLLIEFMDRFRIDLSDGTPAHLSLLCQALNETAPPATLKQLLIGGEAMPPGLAADFLGRFKQKAPLLTNIYGTAECCVDSLSFDVAAENAASSERIPLGRPLANERVHVLDAHGNPQPIGVAGEICISGDGVSRGYLNRPSLDARKFVESPFEERVRMYRTGDLGRWLPQGDIEFLGRVDDQVKIRGFRVELGEIENVLKTYKVETQARADRPDEFSKVAAFKDPVRCVNCLLTSAYPGIRFNQEGLCNTCSEFQHYRGKALSYFKSPQDFDQLMSQAGKSKRSDYDVLLLFSGGKDSSYVLYRLVDMGFKVLAYTFDNGFISPSAFENIRRITDKLGVESIVSSLSNMDEVFVESLNNDHTVCSGCFKALTTISTQMAAERGINVIVTGLSRGQIFETKLEGLYRQGVFDVAEIEEQLQLFRRVYHSNNDALAKLIDIDLTAAPFEEMHFVDFFRYDDTPVHRIRDYLKERDEYWRQPRDTGFCSSNCMINDVGICVHSRDQGYHNYEAPISWDVRLGLTERQEGLEEVRPDINFNKVEKMLGKIGFFAKRIKDAAAVVKETAQGDKHLAAYYVSNQKIAESELKDWLSSRLPDFMVPTHLRRLESLPLTPNGKVDRQDLAGLELDRADSEIEFIAPSNPVEQRVAEIWLQVLGCEQIGIHDNFFDAGGHSLLMAQVHGKLKEAFGIDIPVIELFGFPTIKLLAEYLDEQGRLQAEQAERSELEAATGLAEAQRSAISRQKELMRQLRNADE